MEGNEQYGNSEETADKLQYIMNVLNKHQHLIEKLQHSVDNDKQSSAYRQQSSSDMERMNEAFDIEDSLKRIGINLRISFRKISCLFLRIKKNEIRNNRILTLTQYHTCFNL